jgi:ubiquinone/menaquinone biosynthesis C-methylase UbiE
LRDETKSFYKLYQDDIYEKRFKSKNPIRKKWFSSIYEDIVCKVPAGARVLDAGCGDGTLSLLLAQKGAIVHGTDISFPNILKAMNLAQQGGLTGKNISFSTCDLDQLPFRDNTFDYVVCNHVLEHMPVIGNAVKELYRVCKFKVLISIPTCLNPCSFVLLGGGVYFKFTRRAIFALPWGAIRVFKALIFFNEGVDEGYSGMKNLPHLWRFPWRMIRHIKRAGFIRFEYGPQTLCLPFTTKWPTRLKKFKFMKNFGSSTMYVCIKMGFDNPK